MLIVGVTGGVAGGKTTVSRIFKEEGAHLIDADQIARELVKPHSPAWRELTRTFGKEILQKNGTIHRKRLADIAFSDSRQRRLLNEILHPRIEKEMGKRVRQIKRKAPNAIVVFDVPLLVETGFHQEMDRVVVVTSKKTQQVERLRKRAGMSEEETRKIIASQMNIKEKVKIANFVIRNEGTVAQTRKRAREVFQELRKIALQKRRRPMD
ncbi:MAG: dephospho-CoA kinase [Deltaproteobacteria bacterium]|nr:dephospho-CoA kinase [Deltaproteobacteria bacterium]